MSCTAFRSVIFIHQLYGGAALFLCARQNLASPGLAVHRNLATGPRLTPRPTKPFFVTWFTKGEGVVTTPLMNLKLTGPEYDCLVPWYRVGSPLSIDTKIMKIGQRMTSQWRFQTWPDSKSGFSVKIDQNWKKNHFFARKVPNIGISLVFCL